MDSPYICVSCFPAGVQTETPEPFPGPGVFGQRAQVNELRGRLRDLPGDSDLYIFCDVLKYLVRMRADARSSIIIMIQLRYVRIS